MTERELDNYLREEINALQNVLTDKNFLNERNIKKVEFEESDRRRNKLHTRTDKTRFVNADCIFLEYLLYINGKVLAPIDKLHDFRIDKYAPDIKIISGAYFWPTVENIDWMEKGIASGMLTHFVFAKMHRPVKDEILKLDDKVSFEYIKLVPARVVLDNLEDYTTKDGRQTKRYRVL